MLRDVLSEHVSLEDAVVLDVTYGEGRWWGAWRPYMLVGADPFVWEWVVRPDVFIPRDVWGLERVILPYIGLVDVVAVDPPWGRRQRRSLYNYNAAWQRAIIDQAFKIARLLCEDGKEVYVLLHYKEPLTRSDAEELKRVGFRPITRYLNVQNTITWFQLFRVG